MPLQASNFSDVSQDPGSLVFATVKRHKCRAPAHFLNQPWNEESFVFIRLPTFIRPIQSHLS